MGLVNTVVPLERLEEETVQWCREMLALSPFALRLLKASFNAHEDGYAGLQQLAHDANLLFYGSEEAAGGPRRLQGEAPARLLAVPAAAVTVAAEPSSALRIWFMAARPRTLPAAVAPGARRHRAGRARRDVPPAALRRGAARRPVHPGRHQPLQRLLRRPPRRRHRGPPRPGARHRRRPRPAAAGAVATYVAFGLAVLCGVYLVAIAGWELLLIGAASILAGVLYTGGPRPYGYEGLGEVFVFLFFGVVGGGRVLLRRRPSTGTGRRSRSPCRSACSRPRSWSSTTCATSTPTAARASARSPSGSAATAPAPSTRAWSYLGVPDRRRCPGWPAT